MNVKSVNEYKVSVIVEDENFKQKINMKDDTNIYKTVYERTTLNKEEFEEYLQNTLAATWFGLRGFADRFEVEQTASNFICAEVIIHTPNDVTDLQEFYKNTKNPEFVNKHTIFRTLDEIRMLYESNEHAIYVKGFGHLEKDNFAEFEKQFNKRVAIF